MSRQIGCPMLVALLAVAAPALAQRDPWAGSWRGVLTTPEGDDTNVTITLVAGDGGYTGLVTGFGPGTEIRLSSVTASDVQVTVEGATETAFVFEIEVGAFVLRARVLAAKCLVLLLRQPAQHCRPVG